DEDVFDYFLSDVHNVLAPLSKPPEPATPTLTEEDQQRWSKLQSEFKTRKDESFGCPFQTCSFQNNTFFSKKGLECHVRNSHKDTKQKSQCDVCNGWFVSLANHKVTHR